MNITQAKQIPLHRIAEHLGGTFSRKGRNGEVWYLSPFRPTEHTASFKIDERKNRWHDFGHVSPSGISGGDVIALWCEYHHIDRKAQIREVLDALRPFASVPDSPADRQARKQYFREQSADMSATDAPRFRIVKLHRKIFFPSLLDELQRRRISPGIANLYLKQVFLGDAEYPARKLNGFAFANRQGGYEVSIPQPVTGRSFKTSIRPKAYTLIEGQDKSRALVFEGFWDFLSYLELKKTTAPSCDVYVLNSVSFWRDAAQDIVSKKDVLKQVLLFMDNDPTGDKATDNFCLELAQFGIEVRCQRHRYKGAKDLNGFIKGI